MRIVVLGATGGTGREVVEQALDAGHEVVAFVRHPEALQPRTGLTVIRGTLDDVPGLTEAVTGADALICCIGPKDPMDFIRGDLVHRAMRTAITAMRAAGVDRLVLMSALGAGDTAPITPASLALPARTVMRAVYRDKEKAEAAVAASGLDARIVYPVMLTKRRPTGQGAAAADHRRRGSRLAAHRGPIRRRDPADRPGAHRPARGHEVRDHRLTRRPGAGCRPGR